MHKRTKQEQGIILISTLFFTVVLASISVLMTFRSVTEMKALERQVDRARAYCAAEGGLQKAFSQIGYGSYTGFTGGSSPVSHVFYRNNEQVGTCSAKTTMLSEGLAYVESVGTGIYTTRALEARVRLDSLFSKYFVFCEADKFSSGKGAQYSYPIRHPETGEIMYDENGRAQVAQDDLQRALMYMRGDWEIDGPGVLLYGNAYVENDLIVTTHQNSLDVTGDTYVKNEYIETGTLIVDDTYDDGPDKQKMNAGEEEGPFPTLTEEFYRSNSALREFWGTPGARSIEFVPSDDGTYTIVHEYNNKNYSGIVNTYPLPHSAIIFVDGDANVRGRIAGKVTVYATDDIHIQGELVYNNGLHHADANHSAAYLAEDIIYFNHPDMYVEGIFYAGKTSNAAHAQDASRTLNGDLDLGGKDCITVVGNRIMEGNSFMSHYAHRKYIWDPYLRTNPPPGLPITSAIAAVREIEIPAS